MTKKIKGFTLIELIVVIAIIGVLAAILVPSMIGYLNQARAAKLNANARIAYSAAQATLSDNLAKGTYKIEPDCLYYGTGDGIAHPTAAGAEDIYVGDYLGEKFEGNFAFITDNSASYCMYALWCDVDSLEDEDGGHQLTYDEVINSLSTSKPMGCHPIRTSAISDDD